MTLTFKELSGSGIPKHFPSYPFSLKLYTVQKLYNFPLEFLEVSKIKYFSLQKQIQSAELAI